MNEDQRKAKKEYLCLPCNKIFKGNQLLETQDENVLIHNAGGSIWHSVVEKEKLIKPCPKCKGLGKMKHNDGKNVKMIECPKCKGTGGVSVE